MKTLEPKQPACAHWNACHELEEKKLAADQLNMNEMSADWRKAQKP